MSRVQSFGLLSLVLFATALLSSGCAETSPGERVAKLRARYKAELNGFIVQAQPVEEVLEGEMVEEEEMDVPSEEEGEVVEIPAAVKQNVLLDILVRHDSAEKLAGVTVDIHMVDSAEKEKGHWLLWVDTSTLEKATHTQFTHILDNVSYEEGDGFAVEVRHPVPEEEWGEYKEFSTLQ